MRKILLAGLFLFSVGAAKADDVFFKMGPLEFNLPLMDVSATFLWDFRHDVGLGGAETPVFQLGQMKGTVGAVVDATNQGLPFASISFPLPTNIVLTDINFGAWFAYDFQAEESRAGVKASIPLW